MALNVGLMADIIERIAGKAGVNQNSMSREMILRILNSKAKEFIAQAGTISTKATIKTLVDITEYGLLSETIAVTKVLLGTDEEPVIKITFNQKEALKDDRRTTSST